MTTEAPSTEQATTHPTRPPKLAMLAVAGLLSGLSACAATPPPEAVVDPKATVNTQAPAGTATATAAETVDPGDLAPRKQPKGHLVFKFQSGAKNCCKGLNECKGKGNCKTDLNDCAGRNECKGKGGCKGADCDASATPTPAKDCCKGKNDCKGLGGCKTDRHACKGQNDCKSLGGCKTC